MPIKTHDVILRFVSLRPGPGGENHASQMASSGNALYNIVVDHSTFSWGVDSNIETWYRVYNSTIQWSLISEGLNCSTHSKGCHSKGLMIGGYAGSESKNSIGSENISVLNNLMAHNADRNPLMQMCGIGQVINNVTYNASTTFSHQQLNCKGTGYEGTSYVNWINNYHKKGPSGSQTDLKIIPSDSGVCSSGKTYMNGNVGNNGTWSYSFSGSCDTNKANILVTTPASAPVVATTNANDAYVNVLTDGGAGNSKGIGCDGVWYNRRDSIDTRIVNDVKNGTGQIIDNPSQVGGWITPASGSPCAHSDNDGMPDVWENKYGFNPSNSADGITDADGDGYTNLEEYLNGTDPGNANVISVTSTPVVSSGVTATLRPSATLTPTPRPTNTPTPRATLTPTPRLTSTPIPTKTPTPIPTKTPTPKPTVIVTPGPTGILGKTLTFIPTDDAEIDANRPSSNRGSENEFNVDGYPNEQFLMKFNVSGVGSKKIKSAILKLYNIHASYFSGGRFKKILNNSWNESSVTWNNRPSVDTLDFASLGRVVIGNWYFVDLSPVIKGDGIYGIGVYSKSPDGAGYVSSEGESSKRPRLEITLE